MKRILTNCIVIAVLTFTFGCKTETEAYNLDANREVVLKYHEVWTTGRLNDLDNILAEDFVCHFIGGLEWIGLDGAKNSISNHKVSFPDWKEKVVDIIAERDKVVTRFKSTGTHQGMFAGIDSTGNEVEIYETAIYRIENGKIVEQWGFPDEMSLRHQLSTPEPNNYNH